MSRTKNYLRSWAALIGSVAVGLAMGASWLLVGNGDATELVAACAIVAFGAPLQFLRSRAPPNAPSGHDPEGKAFDRSTTQTIS